MIENDTKGKGIMISTPWDHDTSNNMKDWRPPFNGITISTLGIAISTIQRRLQGSKLPEVSRYPLMGITTPTS
ncbi:hypothetical protein J1N35_025395 [Gossypium stocksii]|uniref:Uncharacterized protein n=1 Tax=Gossypium stocksii TaxID=47602 RepID=A0A9D3ZX38_9ROSI|nr:hypothetical protein J1N35_025395 [Gossypium stocksii]